jgi:nicotinamide-nucleotide amidase
MPEAHDLPDHAHDFEEEARAVLDLAAAHGLSVATAESCTGGLLASLFTDIQGYSGAFERGFVTYSEESKCELLGIEPIAIQRHGVVSAEIALAMAQGALEHSRAGISCGITGFAGPSGGEGEDGLVHIAVLARGNPPILRECHFGDRDRAEARRLALAAALEMMTEALEAYVEKD